MQGWIKLHRKLMCSDIFQNEKLLKVFIYCLLKATHTEHETKIGRQKIKLTPGQFIYGRKKAALELDFKESTVRDYIDILKSDGVISIKSTNKYSVITVINWELYQTEEEKTDNKDDSKRTAKGQQKDTNKNGNNGENGNNDINNIFEYWNSKGITVHRSLNQKAKSHINARLKDYSIDEVLKAIDNYKTVLESDLYWWTHKYTLEKFMSPDKLVSFVDESEPLKSFLKKGVKQNGSTSGSDKAKQLIEEYNLDF